MTDTNGINCDSIMGKSVHFTNLETEVSSSHIDKLQKHEIMEQLSTYDKNGNSVFNSEKQIEIIEKYKNSCNKLIHLLKNSLTHLFHQKGIGKQWDDNISNALNFLNDSVHLEQKVETLCDMVEVNFNNQTHQSRILMHHYHFVKSLYDYYYLDQQKEEDMCSTFEKACSHVVLKNPLVKLMSDHILYGEPIEASCLPINQMNIQILDNRGYKKSVIERKAKSVKVQVKSKKIHQSVNQEKLLRPFLSGVPFNPVYVLLNNLPDQKKSKNTNVKLCHIEEISSVKSSLKKEEDINHHIKQESMMFVSNASKNVRYFIDEKKYNDQSYFCNKKFIDQYEKLEFILPLDEITKCHRVPQTPFLFYDLKEPSTNYVHTVMDKQKDPKKDARLYDRRFKLNMKTINKLFSKNDKKELKFIDSNFESYGFMQEVLKLVTGQQKITSFNDPDFINKLRQSTIEDYDDICSEAKELSKVYENSTCVNNENDDYETKTAIKQVEYQDHDIWLKNVSPQQMKDLSTYIATYDLECYIIKSKKKNSDLQLRMKRIQVDKTVRTLRSLGFNIDTNINHYRRLVIEYVKPDELYMMAKKIVKYELTLVSNDSKDKKKLKDCLLEKYYNEPLKSSIINVLYDFGEMEYEEYKHYEKIMYFKGPSLSISQREQILDLFFWVHLSDYFFDKDSGQIVKVENEKTRQLYERIYEQSKTYRTIFEYILYQYKLNGVRVRCINSYERTGENRGRNAKKRIRVFREERAYIYDQKYSKHIGITKDGIVVACKKKIDSQNDDVYLLNYSSKNKDTSNHMNNESIKQQEKDQIKEEEDSKHDNTNVRMLDESMVSMIEHDGDQFEDILNIINQSVDDDKIKEEDHQEPPIKKIKTSNHKSKNVFKDKSNSSSSSSQENESQSSNQYSSSDSPIQNMDTFDVLEPGMFNDDEHMDMEQDEINQINRCSQNVKTTYEDDMDFITKDNEQDNESDDDLNILETSVMQMRTILFNKKEFYDSQINILESLKSYFRMGHTYFQNITAKTKNFKSKIEKIANKLKNLTEKDQVENYDMMNDKDQIIQDLKFVKKIKDIVDQNFINKN